MLPNPEFKWEKQPEIVVWRKVSENGQDYVKRETYGISGCVGLFEETLKENKVLAFNMYICYGISWFRYSKGGCGVVCCPFSCHLIVESIQSYIYIYVI